MKLTQRTAAVHWQGIIIALCDTLTQLPSTHMRTIDLLLLLLPSDGGADSRSRSYDGLPERLQEIVAAPQFKLLESVRITL